MDEEEKKEPAQEFGAQDYIDQLSQIKETMVSKDEYQKILDDNRKMANALANGIDYGNEKKKEPADIDELRQKLFAPENQRKSNLQYFAEVLALRDALIEAGEQDPFLPFNREYIPNQQDADDADRIANNIQECIEYAAGDPHVFNVELQRRCGIKKSR